MRRLPPLAALMVVLAACGGTHSAPRVPPRHRGPAPSRPATVVVVAPVLRAHGAPPVACRAILTSFPPAGCQGVHVAGYAFTRVPGLERFPGGAWQTPLLRITGVWDGRELHVRRVARARSGPAGAGIPMRCGRSTASGMALVRGIIRGPYSPLAAGPCGHTAWVLLPVADPATVRAIHRRYGGRVVVMGWLRRT